MLQIDIAPAAGWHSQMQLQQDTKTVFLQPGSSANYHSSVANGKVIRVGCNDGGPPTEYKCKVRLTGLPNIAGNENGGAYYLHIIPIYMSADVSITANNGNVDLYNAQAMVDSTGKASDELKRIQERVSINPVGNNDFPVNALQSKNGICKRFTVRPSEVSGPAEC
jgi:hypothetical protein